MILIGLESLMMIIMEVANYEILLYIRIELISLLQVVGLIINADSRAQACMLFRAAFQPNDEMLNCCSIYEEREFKRTKMYRENDNFGSSCHCELGLKIEKK